MVAKSSTAESKQPKDGEPEEKTPQEKKGEFAGKPRGLDIDKSIHVEKFTDPQTGEELPTVQVVHEVATGVNEDGTLVMEKANADWPTPAEGEETAGTGPAGEPPAGTTKSPPS